MEAAAGVAPEETVNQEFRLGQSKTLRRMSERVVWTGGHGLVISKDPLRT